MIEGRSLSAAMSGAASKIKALATHHHNSTKSHATKPHHGNTTLVADPAPAAAATSAPHASPQLLLTAIMITTLLVALVLALTMRMREVKRKRGATKVSTTEQEIPDLGGGSEPSSPIHSGAPGGAAALPPAALPR